MSAPGDWSAAPPPHPADDGRRSGQAASDREARGASATSAVGRAGGRADGRVHGTPAPSYGEYAPAGWVNPVLVEQERREREAESRALREQAAREAVESAGRSRAASATTVTPGRFGRSPLDFGMTVALLVLGLVSVLQSLAIAQVASAVRQTFEQRYTALSDPSGLTTAAVVGAIAGVVLFLLTAWWSVRRLRARRWTFWVPLLGGVVSTAVSVVAFAVVVMQDPAFVDAVMRQSGAA